MHREGAPTGDGEGPSAPPATDGASELDAPAGTTIAVVGAGDRGRRAVERFARGTGRAGVVTPGADGDAVAEAGAALVAVDAEDLTEGALARIGEVADAARFAVVVAAGVDREAGAALARLDEAADAVVALPGEGEAALSDGLERLSRLLGTRSVVNLDVADLVTVLGGEAFGAFAHGRGDAETAVDRAVSDVPSSLRIGAGRTALVHVVGSPSTSVETVDGVVDAVRARVDRDAHLIWGTTVDDDADGLELELVVGGVARTHAAGDPCPRCGATLSGYSLGERSTVACDACGFAGSSVRFQ